MNNQSQRRLAGLRRVAEGCLPCDGFPKPSKNTTDKDFHRTASKFLTVARLRGADWTYLVTFIGTVIWLLADPYAERLITILVDNVRSSSFLEAGKKMFSVGGLARTAIIFGVLGLLFVALILELARLWGHRKATMSIRRMLLMTLVIGGWCGLLATYPQIAWRGKCLRSLGRVNALDRLAESLHQDWPAEDGAIEGLGPFTAYPFGQPTVLLLLTPYPLEGTETVISAIERSPNGVLRFQLGGSDGGDWIEWHVDGLPESFTGGLAEKYSLKKYAPLRGHWYLARYGD